MFYEAPAASSEAEATSAGDSFPESPTLPPRGTAITTASSSNPDEPGSSPPTRTSITRIITPRPQLFTSLEEARDHVCRKSSDTKSASRHASSGGLQTQSEDDEPLPGDMNQPKSSRAVGRSLTGHAEPQFDSPSLPTRPSNPVTGTLSNESFVIWEDVPKPLNTSSSHVSDSAPSASHISGSSVENIIRRYGQASSSVDNIIGQYGQVSSSAAPSQAAVYGGSSTADIDHLNGQTLDASQGKMETVHFRGNAANSTLGDGDHRFGRKVLDKSVPPGPPAVEAPLHPSNPFFMGRRVDTTGPNMPDNSSVLGSVESFPLLDEPDRLGIPHDEAQLGSDVRRVSVVTSGSEAVSVAESKVGPMVAPSTMHSVCGRKRCRPLTGSSSSLRKESPIGKMSEGGTDASEAEDDPFQYDQRRGPFLQPSRERVVSANLRKISGLPRESTATVYSQDGTPSRTFYGEAAADYFTLDGQPIMPSVPDPALVEGLTRKPAEPARANVTKGFYDSNAIKADWASGEPDVVRVPVARRGNFFGSKQSPGVGSSKKAKKEVGLAALGRHEGDKRITGNTDD